MTSRCWPGSAPSRSATPSTPQCWRRRARERKRASRRRCWISGSWPGSATFMCARRCILPGCRQSETPQRSPARPAHPTSVPNAWSKPSRRCSTTRSRPAARRCAITSSPTVNSACSSITFAFTIATAKSAGRRAAAALSNASCRMGARRFIVRHARSNQESLPLKGEGGVGVGALTLARAPNACPHRLRFARHLPRKRGRKGIRQIMSYQNIIVETRGKVGLIRLNRPQALNALNSALVGELGEALNAFEADPNIGCIVMTGSDKAFAAGADIKEMADKTFVEAFLGDFAANWHGAAAVRKPVIAAVAGFALGGGCELAMQCDLIIAADNAKFGQPEIKLGIIPGIGGTQRLTHAVGKAKAMDLILTGRMMDAQEAERSGLVARVVPAASLLDEAMKVAETIASMSLPSVLAAKEAVNRAFETSQAEGIRFERRIFHSLFATADQGEGMHAFIEKRPPKFENK